VHLKFRLIRGVTFVDGSLKRGVIFVDGSLIRGVTFVDGSLIRGVTFVDGSLIGRVTFVDGSLIREGLLYFCSPEMRKCLNFHFGGKMVKKIVNEIFILKDYPGR
jgi:hypothetical protein